MRAARREPHDQTHLKLHQSGQNAAHYWHLAGMVGVHFVIMYALMYLMVDSFSDVFLNANNFYMSGAMAAPMAALMLLFMRSMYRDQKLNWLVYGASAVLLVAFVVFTRQQTLVGDKQFLKSMIPHHSGAVLMCDKASITDAEIKGLCAKIVAGQKAEITQMKEILSRLN
jgi:hypothetical protein